VLEENGGVSKASIGVVLRSILTLEEAGAGGFFGEPPFDVSDLMRTQHYDVEEALTSLGIGRDGPFGRRHAEPARLDADRPADSRMAPADEEVRARLVAESPLRVTTFAAPDRESGAEILGARLASADVVAATPPPPGRRERSVFGTLHGSRR